MGKAKLIETNGNVVKEVPLAIQNSVEAKSYWDYIKDIATNK